MYTKEEIQKLYTISNYYSTSMYITGRAYSAAMKELENETLRAEYDDAYDEMIEKREAFDESFSVLFNRAEEEPDEEEPDEEESEEEPTRSIFDLDDGFYVISSLSVPQAAIYWKNNDVWSLPYELDDDLEARLDALQYHLDNDNVDQLILDYWSV